jgi:parallel beta-helix repeat protein
MATAILVSGSVTPSEANATTYYVAKTGSDNNSCTAAQSTSSPKLTIKSGLSCLKAGDNLSIRKGTYNEVINTQSQSVPTGTSWSNPVTIAAYSGEIVTLKPSSGLAIHIIGNSSKYLIFDRLVIDAVNLSSSAVSFNGNFKSDAGHIRLTNCEIKNAGDNGIIMTKGSNFNEILKCNIHHNGNNTDAGHLPIGHGIYVESSNNRIEGCELHHMTGFGIHVYNGYSGQRASDNVVKNNLVYSNSRNDPFASGILIGSGDNNMAYNNVVYSQPVGIMVGYNSSTNSKVYNNTVYNNSIDGIQIRSSSSSATITNNSAYDNGTNIHNYSNGTTFTNNLTTDPSFTNASAGDFTLRSGSAAINAGITLSQVSDDFRGIPRPQGGRFDIGAYEYSTTTVSPSTPTNLQVVVHP